jgi:hypothetical protein
MSKFAVLVRGLESAYEKEQVSLDRYIRSRIRKLEYQLQNCVLAGCSQCHSVAGSVIELEKMRENIASRYIRL